MSQPQPPLAPADAFLPPSVLQASIAPDGRHVAVITNSGFQTKLLLVKTDDLSNRTIIEGRWVREGNYHINKNPRRVSWITPSLMAVDYGIVAQAHDLNGKRVSELGTRVIGKAVPSAADSPLMLVYDDEKRQKLALVDAQTGDSRAIRYPMSGKLVHWAFDERGQLRALTLANSAFWTDETVLTHWYRRAGADEWNKQEDYKVTEDSWVPLSASATSDELVVASRHGRDTSAIFSYDALARRHGEPLAAHPKEDIVGVDDVEATQYLSVVTLGMKPVRHWFDGRWAALQKAVDEALPQRVNRLSGQERGQVLIFSYGDVDPGRWYLLDSTRMALRLLLVSKPNIEPAAMRPMAVMSYAAKDGLAIPAYLTLPAAGQGPHPTVVMVHGGPAIRDHWAWDAEVQLLAARGYAVFQPQFRGSSGFGKAFEAAGYGQWGLGMQDDITAGVEHLVRQGVADPQRVCIYGASYGGYAAVWGLIKTPALYRCGISKAGVSDIEYALTDSSDSNRDKATREIQRHRIGDSERDKAKFDQVSPLQHARAMQAPLLIAHGDDDERVPISHARKLMKAMDQARKPYEWLLLEGEGHAFADIRSQVRFAEAMFGFLDKHIGPGAAAAKAPTTPP